MKRSFVVAVVFLIVGGIGAGLFFIPGVGANIMQEIFGDDPDVPSMLTRGKNQFSKEEFMMKRSENIAMYRGIHKGEPFDPHLRPLAIRQMEEQESELARSAAPQAAWTELGPNPIPNAQVETGPVTSASGRVVAIAVHPTNANIVYVGTAQGGLYRSTDGGTTWTRMTETALSLAINAIAIAPSSPDTVYIGTGEAGFCGDCYSGVGIYRITGASGGSPVLAGPFNQSAGAVDLMTGCGVGAIAVHPTDPNTIFVVTGRGTSGINGSPTTPVLPDPGIFRSTNAAGLAPTFTKLTITGLAFQDYPINDVVIDPLNANNLVLSLNDIFGDGVGGIYRTTDALAATPTFAQTLALSSGTSVRTELAAHRNVGTWTIYAASGQNLGTVFRSTTGGASFGAVNTSDFCTPQCFYDVAVAVDPTNAANVYLGGSPAQVFGRSTDSGTSFTADGVNFTAGLHVDSHAIAVAPSAPTTVYFGSDGGIYKTTDVSATPIVWTSLNNSTFTATQFMGLDVHPTDPNITIGGTQDNGTNRYTSAGTWTRTDFGDGGYSVIDQSSSNITTFNQYHTYFNGSTVTGYGFSNSSTAFENWTFRGCSGAPNDGITCTGTILFYAPLERGPGTPNTVYYGADRLYRSADTGDNHTTVSQTFGSPISAIGISPQNDNVRIIGQTNGGIFGTTTGANPLTNMDPVGGGSVVPDAFIARAVVDPNNVNTAYVTLTTFTATNVWKTINLSSFAEQGLVAPTWTAAATGLPVVPVNAFIVDPLDSNQLYAGTDIGVYTSGDGGANWAPFGTGLPRVAVFDITIAPGTPRMVRIATHGRGLWQTPVFGATAANVSVAGRVFSAGGWGLPRAQVTMTDSNGNSRQAITNPFGYYRIDDVAAGQTYTVSVAAKGHAFQPRVITVNDELTDLDFISGQ